MKKPPLCFLTGEESLAGAAAPTTGCQVLVPQGKAHSHKDRGWSCSCLTFEGGGCSWEPQRCHHPISLREADLTLGVLSLRGLSECHRLCVERCQHTEAALGDPTLTPWGSHSFTEGSVSTTACVWELRALKRPWEGGCSQASQCHHPIPLRGTDLSPWGSHSPMGSPESAELVCGELLALRCPLEGSIQAPQCHHPIPLRGARLTP